MRIWAMALELIEAARVRQAVLTHLDKSWTIAHCRREVPAHVLVGYDGLEIVA
jgi:phosphoribosyl 1,2-cyclic phosphate phosphodiesterase